jgi:uncharacterized protein (DUF1330 family)
MRTADSDQPTAKPGFAIALIEHTNWGNAISEYINAVQATFEPFGGRFRVHGGSVEVVEGRHQGAVVIVEFPSMLHARQWYESPSCRRILHLRADNTRGAVILVEGVQDGYCAGRSVNCRLPRAGGGGERWCRKSEHGDEWTLCDTHAGLRLRPEKAGLPP